MAFDPFVPYRVLTGVLGCLEDVPEISVFSTFSCGPFVDGLDDILRIRINCYFVEQVCFYFLEFLE